MIKKINNYQILSKIASGGMSEVYLAGDISSGKKVALKILDAKLSVNPEYLRRFKKEASICQQLDHKNIVKIRSFGTFEESYYIAYEYIEGITLDKLIRQKDLTITEIENISIQILEGLSFAHSKNIIHRDIKPSNIMIEDGTVKILDFGIAKQEHSVTVTKTGLFMGSPHYVSPEQIEGHDIDYRSDIYSFGIVLYEMIEGKVPFSADTPWGIIRAHLDKNIPEITKDIPVYLKEIVLKCMSKRKEDRFKSANEIISVINNKEETGKKTVIIDREFEATKKEEKQIDYTKLDMEYYEEKRKHKVKLLGAITIPILFIIIIIGIIIIVNLNNKNYIVENTSTSSFIITTTAAETTTQAIQTTTAYYETTTTQYHNTTTTSYSNKNYENELAEAKFLDKMDSLLGGYNSVTNHINTYGGGNLTFGESNTIEFEGSVSARCQELSNKLKSFNCPSSYENDKNNLIGIADAICFYQNEVVENNKNGSYEAYINSFNACNQKISDLFNYNKSMVSIYNNKYH
ncbi:MAG: serine/threonine-protein kinase [Candidatus Humimicrobiaceae bacterium]